MGVVVLRGVRHVTLDRLAAEPQDGVGGERDDENHTVLLTNLNGVNPLEQRFGNHHTFFCNSSFHRFSILHWVECRRLEPGGEGGSRLDVLVYSLPNFHTDSMTTSWAQNCSITNSTKDFGIRQPIKIITKQLLNSQPNLFIVRVSL